MQIPADLKYTKDHEWVRDEGDGVVTIGITHFAQEALGDIVYVELPAPGTAVEAHGECCVVESVKAVSDVYSPVTGEVLETNDALDGSPDLVNETPYTDGWMMKIKLSDVAELDGLLDAEGYQIFLTP